MAVAKGAKKVLLFRRLGDKTAAAKLVLQTEHSVAFSRDADSVITKDGAVQTSAELETEISISALQSTDDPTLAMLKNAVIDEEKLEVWEVNLNADAVAGKYPAMYAQGLLTEWEETNNAEDSAEISGTFVVDLKPQFGEATITQQQIEAIQYAFADTTVII